MLRKIILTILSCWILGATPVRSSPAADVSKVAVFPFYNETGDHRWDWLSFGLQNVLEVETGFVSSVQLIDFTKYLAHIREQVPELTLNRVARLEEGNWREVAEKASIDGFIWGTYRIEGHEVVAHIFFYRGVGHRISGDVRIRVDIKEMRPALAARLLELFKIQWIPVTLPEREYIHSGRFVSIEAWESNTLGFWGVINLIFGGIEKKEKILGASRENLEKAVEIDPEYAAAWQNLALHYFFLGDYPKAKTLFGRALTIRESQLGETHPRLVPSLKGLSRVNLELGDLAKAEVFLERALKIYKETRPSTHPDVARIMRDLAVLHTQKGNLAEAESLHQKALTYLTDALGPDDPDVASSHFQLGLTYLSQGQYSQAVQNLKKSFEINKKVLGPDNIHAPSILDALGYAYFQLSEYEKAEQHLKWALAANKNQFGPRHPKTAKSMHYLALLYRTTANFRQSEALFKEALAILQSALGPEHVNVAIVMDNLARLYQGGGRLNQAEALYNNSLEIQKKSLGDDHPYVAVSLKNLASLYMDLARYSRAEQLLKSAMSIFEKTYGPKHMEVAGCLNDLARLNRERGDYAQAVGQYREVLKIVREVYGPDHRDVAVVLDSLGQVYHHLGEYDQAERLYKESMEINKKILGADHPSVATGLHNLAALYKDLREFSKADPQYEASLEIYRKALGSEHPNIAITLKNRGNLKREMGEYSRAEALYKESLDIFEKTLGMDHPHVAGNLANQGELYTKTADYDKADQCFQRALVIAVNTNNPELLSLVQLGYSMFLAEIEQMDAAVFFGKQAVNTIQGMRNRLLTLDPDLQGSFLKRKQKAYKHLTDILIEQGRLLEAQQVMAMLKEEEYFEFIRREFKVVDSSGTKAALTTIEKPLENRFRQISGRLASIGREYAALKQKKKFGLSKQEQVRFEQLSVDMKVARQVFREQLEDIKAVFQKMGGKRAVEFGEKNLKSLRAIQGALRELGPGVVLLHYLITEDKLRILLTTPDMQIHRDSEIGAKELNNKIFQYRKTIQSMAQGHLVESQDLYRVVIKPIADDLKLADAKTIMVSLDGALRYLPLAALHDGHRYLIEKYNLAIYTAASGTNLSAKPARVWRVAGMGVSEESTGFDPIPAVKEELEGIVKQEDENDPDGIMPGVLALNGHFTSEAFSEALNKGYQVIHIASHFVFHPGSESDSFLLLGEGERLSLADIRDGDFPFYDVDLLTLSACNTAMGGVNANGREIEGFGALAQNQGAKGVLATLWPVADESTGIFMQKFYHLRQGQPDVTKAETLRRTQVMFIRNGEQNEASAEESGIAEGRVNQNELPPKDLSPYTHPFFWVPFILMGNWL